MVIGELPQGSEFTKCISSSDFNSKGISDAVTVADKCSNGCCPSGFVPGVQHSSNYWGAQVVCGFKPDGSVGMSRSSSNGVKSCTYNKCYVVNMNHITCADGGKMKLDGCCSQWPSDCSYYKKSSSNSGQRINYCLNYAKNYKLEGTSDKSDDQYRIDGANKLSLNNLRAYTVCGAAWGNPTTTALPLVTTTATTTTSTTTTTTPCIVGDMVLGTLAQGQEFSGCIKITDFNTKGITDTVSLACKDENGCCPDGYIPGIEMVKGYWSSMIVCGFQEDGSVKIKKSHSGSKKCNYGKCYVVRMDVTCADDSKMRLDGCCPDGEWTNTCKSYKMTAQHFGDTVNYCSTYASNFKTEGTNDKEDDQREGRLVLPAVKAYTACAAGFHEGGLELLPSKATLPSDSSTGDATGTVNDPEFIVGCGDIPEFLCTGGDWNAIMCKDGFTPWAGQSCVEMARTASCGQPCPPHMKYATHNDKKTCRGKCLTCQSKLFERARLAIGWKPDNSKLIKCRGNEYTMRTDDYDLPNYLTGLNGAVCSNEPETYTYRYVCVDGDMHYRVYPRCEQEKDDGKFFGCKIIEGEDGAGDGDDGDGFFERDEVDIGFEISGLEYDDIMDDTRKALKDTIANLVAAGISVPQSYIDIYLSKGSVKVTAKVKAAEAGVDATALTASASSSITPAAIVDEVKKVPNIASAAVGGSLDSVASTAPKATKRNVSVTEILPFDCAVNSGPLLGMGTDGGYDIAAMDFSAGTYTKIYSIPFGTTTPPFIMMNAFGISPVDNIGYACVVMDAPDMSVYPMPPPFYIVRFDSENIEFIAKVQAPAGRPIGGAFDIEGNYYIISNPSLLKFSAPEKRRGFSNHTDERLPLYGVDSPIHIIKNLNHTGQLADIVAIPGDFDGKGAATWLLAVNQYGWMTAIKVLGMDTNYFVFKTNDVLGTVQRQAFGGSWNIDGDILVLANGGQGIFKVPLQQIQVQNYTGVGKIILEKVGESPAIPENDGFSCLKRS